MSKQGNDQDPTHNLLDIKSPNGQGQLRDKESTLKKTKQTRTPSAQVPQLQMRSQPAAPIEVHVNLPERITLPKNKHSFSSRSGHKTDRDRIENNLINGNREEEAKDSRKVKFDVVQPAQHNIAVRNANVSVHSMHSRNTSSHKVMGNLRDLRDQQKAAKALQKQQE